jgi:hypothetical protein
MFPQGMTYVRWLSPVFPLNPEGLRRDRKRRVKKKRERLI